MSGVKASAAASLAVLALMMVVLYVVDRSLSGSPASAFFASIVIIMFTMVIEYFIWRGMFRGLGQP